MSNANQFWAADGDDAEPELSPRECALRDAFVREYLLDYNAGLAAIRLGYKASVANTYASRFLDEPYVQRKIKECERGNNDVATVIKSGLIREANYSGSGASHSARVSALTQLSRIEGIDKSAGGAGAESKMVLHLTPDHIAQLSDEELDAVCSIFSKLGIDVATKPESVS